ncbi:uncharacterized protein LOC119588133 [Penaeus monodon]|uniref:uncharacterized protein LOC119588133 n=1 Tax=Penaeus monodon TaxID=6687 RepID=UPI0018A7BA92|nr:uncharacterized protein LOC119588133 [Penaeus monodon]
MPDSIVLRGLKIAVTKEFSGVWVQGRDSASEDFMSVATDEPSLFSLGCHGPPCAQCIGLNCGNPDLSAPDCSSYLLHSVSLPLNAPYSISWRPEGERVLTVALKSKTSIILVPKNDRNRTHRIHFKTEGKYVRVDIPSLDKKITLEDNATMNAMVTLRTQKHPSRWILPCSDATTGQS